MKKLIYLLSLLFFVGCAAYKPFWFDNGKDYVVDGMYRIEDKQGLIGYANAKGRVIIKPRFAFGFPFEDGKAKVTYTGMLKEACPTGEYHYWDSDHWFFIDKAGNEIAKDSSAMEE